MNNQSNGENRVWEVSELTRSIKGVLEGSFPQLWVRGEICEYSPNRASGHVYFAIKDTQARLRLVFFRGLPACQQLGLAVGTAVEILGRLTVYEPQGSYQMQVIAIRPVGMGDLRQRFEEMKERLRAEGLFDQEHKRPIPAFPRCVGVLTSRDAAALTDFLRVIYGAHAGMHIRIFPVPVQGKEAAPYIAHAIEYVNRYRLCEVLVVTRGGGSLEDLWPFNEEVLARAIYASEIPVISAVGHERDHSISDFVADHCSPTPTAAAKDLTQATTQLVETLGSFQSRMAYAMRSRLHLLQGRLNNAVSRPCLTQPEQMVNARAQYLDQLTQRLTGTLPQRASREQSRLENLTLRLAQTLPRRAELVASRLTNALGRLHALVPGLLAHPQERLEKAERLLSVLSPQNVLTRGYSILRKGNGQIVRTPQEVTPGERLNALLSQGEITVTANASEA